MGRPAAGSTIEMASAARSVCAREAIARPNATLTAATSIT